MNATIRVLFTGFAAVTVYFLVYWLPLFVISWEAYLWLAPLVALLCAILVGRYVWISLGSARVDGVLPGLLVGAAVGGGVGFAGGFFGPLIFAPDANQGPLLGIFITGPLGLVLGALAGFIYAIRKPAKAD